MSEILSNYSGSIYTARAVAQEIERRWGREEALKYNPLQNCLTFKRWSVLNFKVKPGEKAIHSITFVEHKDQNSKTVRKFPKTVSLFYYLQVEKKPSNL